MRSITKQVLPWLLIVAVLATTQSCSALALFVPSVSVMIAEQEGKAKYAEAESTRQIKVLEAEAALQSAKLLGQAEVERAKGTAEANRILGDSLRGNEAYLRYLWISKIEEGSKEVYYIPTEAGIPILEAGKRGAK